MTACGKARPGAYFVETGMLERLCDWLYTEEGAVLTMREESIEALRSWYGRDLVLE